MEILQILLEDTEKNTFIRENQIIVISLLLTIGSERWEHFTKCSRMFATYVEYVMYGWKA